MLTGVEGGRRRWTWGETMMVRSGPPLVSLRCPEWPEQQGVGRRDLACYGLVGNRRLVERTSRVQSLNVVIQPVCNHGSSLDAQKGLTMALE